MSVTRSSVRLTASNQAPPGNGGGPGNGNGQDGQDDGPGDGDRPGSGDRGPVSDGPDGRNGAPGTAGSHPVLPEVTVPLATLQATAARPGDSRLLGPTSARSRRARGRRAIPTSSMPCRMTRADGPMPAMRGLAPSVPSGETGTRMDGYPAATGLARLDDPDGPDLHPGAVAVYRMTCGRMLCRGSNPLGATRAGFVRER